MVSCQNCKASLGCTCKVRIATDGKSCCTGCIMSHESSLKPKFPQPAQPVTRSAPTQVSAQYKNEFFKL